MDDATEVSFKARAKAALEKEFGATSVLAFQGKSNAMGLLLQITLTDLPDAGAIRAKLEREWASWAPSFGLNMDDLDRKCIYNGKAWTIIGIEPRKKRAPLRAKDDTGATMFFSKGYMEPPLPPKPKPVSALSSPVMPYDKDEDEKPGKVAPKTTFKMPEPLEGALLTFDAPYGEEVVVVEEADDGAW